MDSLSMVSSENMQEMKGLELMYKVPALKEPCGSSGSKGKA